VLPQRLRGDLKKLQRLQVFARSVRQKFQGEVFLVGSALKDEGTPRDWDIRVRLTDANFYKRFGPPKEWAEQGRTGEWTESRWGWASVCVTWTKIGVCRTGLNIDFQIQPEEIWLEYEILKAPRLLL